MSPPRTTSATRNGWELYQFPPSLVLGFHGCDKAIGEALLSGQETHLKPSKNHYDWLGWGIYFWDSNPQRALEFAIERSRGSKNSQGDIKEPFVIGAVINMGHCLNLCDSSALEEMRRSYDQLVAIFDDIGAPLPQNGKSKKLRTLDCAVFELLHHRRTLVDGLIPYQTVRGTYHEGDPLYPDTDFSHQDHTQICVRDTICILGYFRPIKV